MVEWHSKSRRNPSGGMRRSKRRRDKRLFEKGGLFAATRISPGLKGNEIERKEGRSNIGKMRLGQAKYANILDPKTGKTSKMELLSVEENAANREFARRNIVTKGAVVEVKSGTETLKAIVTSRPGQHGTINAILEQKTA